MTPLFMNSQRKVVDADSRCVARTLSAPTMNRRLETARVAVRRILMTADAVGGVWNYALELSRGLGKHGVEVALATMGPRPTREQRAQAAALGNVTLCESEFRLEWMESPWIDVERAGDWLLELERRFAPDLVHLNGFVHGTLPWHAPAMIVGHSCVLSWWRAVHGADAPAGWDRYRATVLAGLHAARVVIAPSRAMLETLIENYGPLTESAVIYNGRNPDDFDFRSEKDPVVLSVGRLWDEAKNTQALASIASELAWPVRVAGSTTAPAGAARGFANVESLGCCTPASLARHYARAAIYALPARYEPFGLSALEAALSGCALVLGDIPSLREIWDDAAVFVSPDDRDQLRNAISLLIEVPAQRRELALRARRRALEFSVERMVTAYLAAYARQLNTMVPVRERDEVFA